MYSHSFIQYNQLYLIEQLRVGTLNLLYVLILRTMGYVMISYSLKY